MTDNPLSDLVSHQYSRWTYPQPILDIPGWLERNWQWFDPSHAHRLFWPDRPYRAEMDILIAGCGANQAAIFAFNNPQARVVALDVSQPSLDHHAFLKARHGLSNLELHRLPIEDVGKLGLQFDLIVSTGVLHHLASPERGMEALAQCLREDGVAAIMLYARFGRVGVEMLQSIFRDMGLRQDDAGVLMVREALAAMPADHPIRGYASIAPDLRYDAGLVDTFLHGRDRSYDIRDCLALVRGAGLVFQDLFLKSSYYPPVGAANPFLASIAMLPEEDQWSVMERVNFRNACHFFLACRPERSRETYRVDFSGAAIFNYIPHYRHRCGWNGREAYRHDWGLALSPPEAALMRQVDGLRSVREVIDAAIVADGSSLAPDNIEGAALTLLKSLSQLDIISLAIPASAGSGKVRNRPPRARG